MMNLQRFHFNVGDHIFCVQKNKTTFDISPKVAVGQGCVTRSDYARQEQTKK